LAELAEEYVNLVVDIVAYPFSYSPPLSSCFLLLLLLQKPQLCNAMKP
jgi:hypothetical protein